MRNRPPRRGWVGVGSPLCAAGSKGLSLWCPRRPVPKETHSSPSPTPSGCGVGGTAMRSGRCSTPPLRCLGKSPDKRSLRGGRPGSGGCKGGCHRVGFAGCWQARAAEGPFQRPGAKAIRWETPRRVCWKEPGVPSGMPVTLCAHGFEAWAAASGWLHQFRWWPLCGRPASQMPQGVSEPRNRAWVGQGHPLPVLKHGSRSLWNSHAVWS